MKSFLILFINISSCILPALANEESASHVNNEKSYKVGFPIVPGLMYRDITGKPTGFLIEITEEILKTEQINYEWVEGDWPDLFEQLIQGKIDLLPGTQRSLERKKVIDFLDESMHTIWSELYISKKTDFTSPTQLKNKKIGVVTNDNNGIGFLTFIGDFDIPVEPVYFESHQSAINALKNNSIYGLAGPKPNNAGEIFAELKRSGIFYNPCEITISFPKKKNQELQKIMNARLKTYKNSPNSIYYQLYRKYNLSNFDASNNELPKQIKLALWICLSLLITTVSFIFLLRIQVARKTQQLKHAKERAEENERLQSSFLANMSHEIRTPLNSIIGFSEILINSDDNHQTKRQYGDIIEKQNQILLNLINDIIDISKIETGNLTIRTQKVIVGQFIKTQYDSFTPLFDSNFNFTCTTDKLVQNMEIEIDALRLSQIITNFLTNALKYTGGGRVILGVKTEKNQLIFYVQDSGPGIPPEKTKLIFERFFKENEFKQGAGLGLSICKSLATLMGGDIQVRSHNNNGALFLFTIPIIKVLAEQ